MLRSFIFGIMAALVTQTRACTDAGSRRNGVDCTFFWHMCGWKNAAGNPTEWNRVWTRYEGWYLRANMTHLTPQDKVTLVSADLCATENRIYQLKFQYYLQSSGKCLLSLSVEGGGERREVWNTTKTSQIDEDNPWGWRQTAITSPASSFRIIFEASKLGHEQCGSSYHAIELDEITLKLEGYMTTTPSTTTTTTTTTTDSSTTSQTTTDMVQTSAILSTASANSTSEATLSARFPAEDATSTDTASVAIGVVLAVVVVVVAIVIVIILVRRQQRRSPKQQRETGHALERRTTGSVSNDFYTAVSNSAVLRANRRGNGRFIRNWPSGDSPNSGDTQGDRPESAHVYSHPDSPSFRVARSAVSDKNPARGNAVGRNFSQDTGYVTVPGHSGDNKITADGYNKLAFDKNSSAPTKANATDTYDHLDESAAAQGKQPTEQNEYSLALGEADDMTYQNNARQNGVSRAEHTTRFTEEDNYYSNLDESFIASSLSQTKQTKTFENSPNSPLTFDPSNSPNKSNDLFDELEGSKVRDSEGSKFTKGHQSERPEYVNMASVQSQDRNRLSDEYNRLDFNGQVRENNIADDTSRADNYSRLDEV